ncbi:MAG TPA: trehalose-6-phosphate synthase [Thermoanaerobaculia bacterium]|jgi:trehalose 6-phosphate synthase|nr:trehalose-6-phosphate synthase [Thermoanaerobaculia bacterium]
MSPPARRLLVVSNRLPIVLEKKEDGWCLKPSSGGLVSALAPVLSQRGGMWIGWPGLPLDEGGDWEPALAEGNEERGYDLVPVLLSEDEVKGFYEGFANGILWPLFHDLLDRCDFEPSFWYAYLDVNRKFADEVLEHSREDDYIWVHDYQLVHVAHFVREKAERGIGFFLHIPFPPLDIFLKLPWRAQVLNALLAYDLIGLQTPRDTRNFLTCIEHLLPEAEIHDQGPVADVKLGSRTIRVGAFPIGIDSESFEESARSEEVAARMADLRGKIGVFDLILGVDRLDYTKGLLERLEAFRNALRRFPELREKALLFQVVVPSREGVPEYQSLKASLEQLVGEINGEFSTAGWVPVHYHYKSLPRQDLLSLYRMARVCFVTSVKDGMNLVAKEFAACQIEGCGVLILSEFAGAAAQLQDGALLVNPHDIEGMADALKQAFDMDEEERHRRMRRMQEIVREQDIFWWVDYYLGAALGEVPEDIRPPREYFPPISVEENWL